MSTLFKALLREKRVHSSFFLNPRLNFERFFWRDGEPGGVNGARSTAELELGMNVYEMSYDLKSDEYVFQGIPLKDV